MLIVDDTIILIICVIIHQVAINQHQVAINQHMGYIFMQMCVHIWLHVWLDIRMYSTRVTMHLRFIANARHIYVYMLYTYIRN